MRTPTARLVLAFAIVFGSSSRPPARAADAAASPGELASAAPGIFLGRSLRFLPPAAPPTPPPAETPLSLTATDGTGLALTGLKARAAVEGPLSLTELHLTFANPEDRVIEGRFRILLPPGAAISRFAMKLDGAWQEGEVVEKKKARAAYEDFLHRRQDPALLETGAGNEFSARVFPIPAKGVKEIMISYTAEISRSGAPYVLPLRGLPEVGELDVAAFSGGASIGELKKSRWVPPSDFMAPLPASGRSGGVRQGGRAAVRLRPLSVSQPDEIASLLILMDTSASRALVRSEQARLLERLVQALARGAGPAVPLRVAAFDQDVEEIHSGTAGDFGAPALERLRRRRCLGASDLEGALRWARKALSEKSAARVLLLTDGVATAGAVEGAELAEAARKLKEAGVERLDAVVLGGLRDETLLKRVVTAGLARDGVVVDGSSPPEELARRLTQATSSRLAVTVAGAAWSWPETLDGVQPGDEVMVYAELPEGRPMKITVGGRAVALESAPGQSAGPLLERALAQARLQSLQARLDRADGKAAKAKLREDIVKLSERARVLSPETALLVLETEEDYARYGIDRKALAEILGIENGRAVLSKRAEKSLVFPKRPERARIADPVAPVRGEPGEPPPLPLVPFPVPAPGPVYRMAMDAAPEASGAEASVMEMDTPELERLIRSREVESAISPPSPSPRPQGTAARAEAPLAKAEPYQGKFKEAMALIAKGDAAAAAALARGWLEENPGELLAYVALGEALEAAKDYPGAARAYGSIIDLFPARADLRRFAGERLERLKDQGLALAVDSFRKARESRPDHPSSHRLYAFALLKQGRFEKAFEVLAEGLARRYPEGRFRGVEKVLAEDLGLIAAAWNRAEPGRGGEIGSRLAKAGGSAESAASLRFVLNWETDANDVDFHIMDGKGGHAFFSEPKLASGGELYADVTTGYGPECFTIRGDRARRAYPYALQAHYYSRGPMGFGMGKLEIIEHDGRGKLEFTERPFVIMADGAYMDLGSVGAPLIQP